MSTRLIRCAAAAALMVLSAPTLTAAASLAYGQGDVILIGDERSSLTPGVTRQINIDGHLVAVSVSVTNVGFVTSPNAPGPFPTSVRVDLRSADDQPLPEVTAIRVKLERVKPPVRIYRSRLYPELTFAADPYHAGYGAELASFHPGVRLNATVTLTTPHETRVVRVGVVRVAPSFTRVTQPDLTE
jgi:hypothetical protein